MKKLSIRKLEELKTTAAGGLPAAHGVDGRTFGMLVSTLAKSAPGAVAAHIHA